jgi:hypothetical protein
LPKETERKTVSVIKALSNLTCTVYLELRELSYAEAFEQAVLILASYELVDDPREFWESYGLPDPAKRNELPPA